jgi:tryptophan-rich hypothetical protein
MKNANTKNSFNKDKLLLSKWTAVVVHNKQKHFLVTELIRDDESQSVIACVLQAVIDKHLYQLDWRELQDSQRWLQGWK